MYVPSSLLCRGRDRLVVGFTTNCAISADHHWCCEFESLCDQVCQLLATGRWFSSVSSTNKTDRHDITEWLKVAFNTIKQANNDIYYRNMYKSMYLFVSLLFFFLIFVCICMYLHPFYVQIKKVTNEKIREEIMKQNHWEERFPIEILQGQSNVQNNFYLRN
jgi:hypothetical protein